jgi:hypothetical protein
MIHVEVSSGSRCRHTKILCLCVLLFLSAVYRQCGHAADISLRIPGDSTRATQINYQLKIQGKMLTPAESGDLQHDLKSDCTFQFTQRNFSHDFQSLSETRAVRRFADASAVTQVGRDHETTAQLPQSHRLIYVYGSENALQHLSPAVRLTRQQVDLLQLPCDPLTAQGLLPAATVRKPDEKWNTEPWVVPAMAGIEATASQTATCSLKTSSDSTAVIAFEAKAAGAVSGSASSVLISGELSVDRRTGLITVFRATMREERTPGTVSPGLDVTAEIRWTQQQLEDGADLPEKMPGESPEPEQLLRTLSTPWRLLLLHSRDWHLFHETTDLVMLRMLRDGRLIGQCNISPSPRVPPGTSTDPAMFRDEVQAALVTRKGKLLDEPTATEKNGWHIQRIRATSATDTKTILWDYYLCTVKSGEQFSMIFSHATADDAIFADAPEKILSTLTLQPAPAKTRLPK